MNSTQETARTAGFLWLLAAATTGFSLVYVRPKLIVSGDAAATVRNIVALETLFRASIASSILSQIFSLLFGVTIFRLLKGVNKTLAMVCLVSLMLGASVGVVNSLSNAGTLVVVTNPDYMKAFQPDQVNALAMTFLRINNAGVGLVELFMALFMFSFGLLIIRSGYLPRILGIFLFVGGCAFSINTFTKMLIPQAYPVLITELTMALNIFGAPATILWLLIKGVKEQPPIGSS